MICLTHPDRDCLYEEAEAVIEYKKDTERWFQSKPTSILYENYPKNNGMIASGILYRKHNDPVRKRPDG